MVKTNKRMTKEEMRIQEEHDYKIVKQEIIYSLRVME